MLEVFDPAAAGSRKKDARAAAGASTRTDAVSLVGRKKTPRWDGRKRTRTELAAVARALVVPFDRYETPGRGGKLAPFSTARRRRCRRASGARARRTRSRGGRRRP